MKQLEHKLATHQAHLAAQHSVVAAHKAGNVAYVYVPPKQAKVSKLQHLAAEEHTLKAPETMLGAPPPGVYQAPAVGGGPTCDVYHLEKLSDDTQIAWDACMNNKNYKEPNSIAQEIYDELDETEDGEVTAKEYCAVARKHTARLTDEQCKEIVKLMDEAAGNNDGVLQYSEFKAAFLKGQEPPEEEEEEERRRRRHLLSWVWVPGEGTEPKDAALERKVKLAEQKHVFYTSSLATFHRVAVDMATCKKQAVGDVCEYIGKCTQPVCNEETMYNNTKVESLCGICLLAGQQGEAGASGGGLGCFALDASVAFESGEGKTVDDVRVGDRIAAAAADGSVGFSRVVFTHEHVDSSLTLKLFVAGDAMELTPNHMVPVYTEECGLKYCEGAKLVKAREVKAGDRLYVSDGRRSTVQTVEAVSKGEARVKYVVTEAGNLLVNGVVASVFATAAKHLETLPFYILDSLFQGIFDWAPVKAAMHAVLESPALQAAEQIVDRLASVKSYKATKHASYATFAAAPASA